MELLEQFIRLQIDEGKKLNALALMGLGVLGANRYGDHLASELPAKEAEFSRQQKVSYDDLMVRLKAAGMEIDTAPRIPKAQQRAEKSQSSKQAERRPVSQRPAGGVKSYSRAELHGFVSDASQKHNVPAAFIDAVIRTESDYDPEALSHKGAQGIMQIMPATARALDLDDPWDAELAIDAGTKHLRQLLDRYDNDYELAAAAYNAGVGNVQKYEGVPPFDETQRYVKRVKERMATSTFAQSE